MHSNNDSSNINFGPNSLEVDSSLPFAFQGKGYSNTPDSEGLIGVCFCTSIKDRLWQIQQTLPVNISNLKNTNHRIAIADYGSSDGLEEWLTSSGILSLPNIVYQKFNVGEFGWSSPVAKNLASSLAPRGYGIFNLDADNFITSSDIKQIFDALNNDQVVHQFSGEWGDGSFGRIGLPPQWFNRLSGYEERLLPMGYQDADILNRAEKLGLEVATIGAPETKAIQNDVETKFAFCSNVDGAKMNYANRVVAECLMASGSLEAGNQISRTILNQNRCLSDESPYDGAHIANASILSKWRTNAIDVGHQLHHSKLKHDFSIGFIRRNIHRLEKSFCFDPWKPNAGEDFLLLLVEQLRSWPKDQLTSELYCSGYIALKKYFDNPLNSALWVEKSRAVFSELSSPDIYQKEAVFSFCETKNDVISEEEMLRACEALFDRRVSVRDYKPESISPDIIEKCVDMALSALALATGSHLIFFC